MKYLYLILSTALLFVSCDSGSTIQDNSTDGQLLLDKTTIELKEGEVEKITVLQAPDVDVSVQWTSDDENIATVFHGSVTGIKVGETTISATVGDQVQTVTVTVSSPEYELVWSDEFDGNSLNLDNWTYEVNGSGGGNQELQYYTDREENIRIEDGILVIEARKENYLSKGYTSARIVSKDKRDFRYGKIEARLKVPKGRGTWPAFWMLGYGSWPRAGEIDIMEHVGYEPNVFHCALHTKNKNGLNGQNARGHKEFDENVANDFHIVTMEWVEDELAGFDRIHIYIDGKKIKTFAETAQLQDAGDWPFQEPFFLILNLAIGGTWGGAQGVDDSMFDEEVRFEIDYVRAYQLQ